MMMEENFIQSYQKDKSKVLIAHLAGLKEAKEKLATLSCIYLISVGKDNFKGDAVEAAVKLINQHYAKCFIVVAGVLQRFNLASQNNTLPEDEKIAAREQEKQWIEIYEPVVKQYLKIPYKIIRWEDFKIDLSEVQSLLEKNTEYQEAMRLSVEEYVKRQLKGQTVDQSILERYMANSKAYLIEECAVVKEMAKLKEKTHIDIVYPGKEAAILALTRKLLINKEPSSQLRWMTFRMNRKNPSLTPREEGQSKVYDANNRYNFHHNNGAAIEAKLSACWYGITKAIVESSIDLDQKIKLMSSLTMPFSKLTSADDTATVSEDFDLR